MNSPAATPPAVGGQTGGAPGLEGEAGTGAPLSDIERRVLDAVIEYQEINDWSPTVRELAELTDCRSFNTPHRALNGLAAKGYIERGAGPRMIRVIQ